MPENDIDLKHAFDRAAGSAPSAPAALSGLRTRIRRAHQRRVLARGGAGLLGVVAVGGVIMNVGGDGSDTEVLSTGPPASDSSALTSTPLGSTTTAVAPSSSAAISAAATPAPTTASPTRGSSPPGTTVVPTTAPIAGQVAVFTAEGGTIVVDYTSSAMTLTSVAANPSWTVAETRAQPDDIEVRFENEDGDDSRIRVRLVDGEPEQDEGRQGPRDSNDDDSSGD
jgi:hypothetical protein